MTRKQHREDQTQVTQSDKERTEGKADQTVDAPEEVKTTETMAEEPDLKYPTKSLLNTEHYYSR